MVGFFKEEGSIGMKKKKAVTRSTQFKVLKGKSLDFITYRGYAPLSELARVSKADIFDQKKNATGSQRNLNKSHARAAYNYVYGGTDVFYPEFILNVRNPRIVKFKPESDDEMYGTLYFTTDPTKQRSITISRVDGNHRLWLVDGSQEGYDPIDREVPFSILIAGDIMKELKIFRDINDNQMGMNTSHLRNIDYRLRGRDVIKARNPALYIARRLQEDKKSAFYQKIHEGGRVEKGGLLSGLTTANLSGAIKDMLTRSSKLPQIGDVDAQYTLIRNYWIAVSKRLSDAWKNPSQYIIFRGDGVIVN